MLQIVLMASIYIFSHAVHLIQFENGDCIFTTLERARYIPVGLEATYAIAKPAILSGVNDR